MNRKNTFTSIVFLLCFSFSSLALAENNNDWDYELTPYFFAAGLNGQTGVNGVTSDVDMSFSDIWNNLDAGAMGIFQARKDRWFYALEGLYFKISDEGTSNLSGSFGNINASGAAEITAPLFMFQSTGGYRLMDGKTRIDAIAALRYTRVETEIKITTTTPGIIFPGGSKEGKTTEGWVDLVVGARVLHAFSQNWDYLLYTDVGAGGSDFTYQIMTGVNWKFEEDYTAKVGYRILDWDYDRDGFLWNMKSAGVYMGLGIKF